MDPSNKIQVWPTKASALNLVHPSGTAMKADGPTWWNNDSFTARRLVDGSITTEVGKAFKAPAASAPTKEIK